MDIKKEREAFVENYRKVYKVDKSLFVNDSGEFTDLFCQDAWVMWQAAKAQAVPEGFVLVPMVPSERMINAVRQCYEGEAYLPYSLYSEFVNQAIIERMEAQEPTND